MQAGSIQQQMSVNALDFRFPYCYSRVAGFTSGMKNTKKCEAFRVLQIFDLSDCESLIRNTADPFLDMRVQRNAKHFVYYKSLICWIVNL